MQETLKQETQTATYEARGTHLLLTLKDCAVDLNDEALLRDVVDKAAKATGATVLQLTSHRFHPQGITVLAVLAESHASLHTYPESSTVFWDCFTCGETCVPEKSIEVLAEGLKPADINKQVVARS